MLVVSLRGWKSQNLVSSRDFRTQRQYVLRLLIIVAHGLCYKVISISKDPATLTHSRGVLLITAYTGRLHPKGVHDLFSPIGISLAEVYETVGKSGLKPIDFRIHLINSSIAMVLSSKSMVQPYGR